MTGDLEPSGICDTDTTSPVCWEARVGLGSCADIQLSSRPPLPSPLHFRSTAS